MSKAVLNYLARFETNLRQEAGSEIAVLVMAGSEKLTARSAPSTIAAWMKAALTRLDELAGAETRDRVLHACGSACAQNNLRAIDQARTRKARFATTAAFLEAEAARPISGARLSWDGEVLRIAYTPYELDSPVRCYCPLLRGLPPDQTVSPGYCQCSRAYIQTTWEAILERPVVVEVESTCLSGVDECRFKVQWSTDF